MSRSDYSNSLAANRLCLPLVIWLLIIVQSSALFGQCSLSCNDGLQVSLDGAGQALITINLIAPAAAANCPGALQLKLFTQQGALIPNNILTCNHIGQTITAQVKEVASGNYCTGTLEVQDALPPNLVCPDKFIFCNQDGSPEAVGFPAMTDNCTPSGDLNVIFTDNITSFPCGTLQNGVPVNKRIDRTWYATDDNGNSNSCVQKIWLKHITLAGISFPPSLDGVSAPALNCGQDPNDLALTGQPTVGGVPIDNSPDCEFGVTYSDQVINICPPAGKSVLRTWTAVDFCSGTISNKLQIIKIEDKTPPVIEAPGDFTVGTDGFLCTGTVLLPPATTSDNCSAVTVSTLWNYGTGFGPFFGVPEGAHTVTYTATDGCGNTATATVQVNVADTGPPQAICSSGLQVSLSANGVGFVSAGTIDQGSFDNCGPVSLAISRNDTLFGPLVQVNCSDIGTILPLTLRVTDAGGLENLCVSEVIVRDFLKPLITCPANKTLSCLQNHADLQLTGQATATDNCALQSIVFVDFSNISACNAGSVTRIWTATDEAGNAKSCVQQIVLNPVSNIAVVFPPDVTVNACSAPGAMLPPATGQPLISGQFCSPLSVTYTDETFPNAPAPFCYRIYRHWKVIDFCIYDPNNDTTGVWKKTQTIDVKDNLPPVLVIPYDLTVGGDSANCQASVVLADAIATDCGNVSVSNNGPFAATHTHNASGVYPAGVHQVVFTATDDCGNSTEQTLVITVKDLTPPVAVCKNDVAVSLDTTGSAFPGAGFFDGGSHDNCNPATELTFSVTPDHFDCQSTGNQQVVLTVSDPSGNSASCTAVINVTDPTGACLPPPPPAFSIEGSIRTAQGAGVADIPVFLTGDGFTASANCDSTGHYLFEGLPSANVYTLKPHNNANWLNGVSTFDLVLISKHILGLNTFDSPYKLIAADANHSGSVTTFDIVQLRKLILGFSDTITGNTSWRFVDAGYNFPNPADPFFGVLSENISFNGLINNIINQDFVGVKIGDLNNTVDAADARSYPDTLLLTLPDVPLRKDRTDIIPVYFKNWRQLEGFQFELKFDATRASVEKVVFPHPDLLDDTNIAVKPDGSLTVSWDHATGSSSGLENDSLLFTLQMTAKQDADTHAAFSISENRIKAEAYRTDNDLFAAIALRVEGSAERKGSAPELLPVYPNPFCGEVVVPFRVPEAGTLLLRVEDASGRMITGKQVSAKEGYNECVIRQAELSGQGLYYYQLIAPNEAPVSGRFVLMCR